MTEDEYLNRILNREAVDNGVFSPIRGVLNEVEPIIKSWAGHYLVTISPSGSFAKGTANRSGTDIDLFISLAEFTPQTLRQNYTSLVSRMEEAKYSPKLQNVSIKVRVGEYNVDLVPGKRQNTYSEDHSLYRRRADTWVKTNIQTHQACVIGAQRLRETRVLKLWRDQSGIEFPSFYLELTVINSLIGIYGSLSKNVFAVFRYLADGFLDSRVTDPANTNNVISDDLTVREKSIIARHAKTALSAKNWDEIIR